MPPEPVVCPHCASYNRPEAKRCHACGRALDDAPDAGQEGLNVLLQRVMGGEVFTAVSGEGVRRPHSGASAAAPPRPDASPAAAERPDAAVEDNSDVLAAAIDRIRAKAQEKGDRFKPYVRSKPRPAAPPASQKDDVAGQLDLGVALLRERRFEEAIEPFLKAIARDDEDRRPWILLGEAYLRIDRPFKAAVAYLRSLELSPGDEQAWLGLGRVLRSLDELPTAGAILERATKLHPDHADTWVERGLTFAAMKDLPEAARSFRTALDLRPDHRVAFSKRAEIEAAMRAEGIAVDEVAPPPVASDSSGTVALLEDNATDFLVEPEGPRATTEAKASLVPPAAETKPVKPSAVEQRERPARVRTFVEGLDETLEGGIPWGHLVLIEGAPGTMKSSIAFSMLLFNAAREGLHCLYLSLEERASSLLRQMGSLGLRLEVPKGSLVVLDPRTAADLLGEKPDWVEALQKGVRSIQAQRGLDLIVIDSLEALEVLAKFKDRRREMYRLFEWLRDLGITSLVVTERPDWLIAGHVLQGRWDEDFLADGVIHLRIHMVSDLEAQRRLRVVKMRGTRHETGYMTMVLDDGGFRVTRAMSP